MALVLCFSLVISHSKISTLYCLLLHPHLMSFPQFTSAPLLSFNFSDTLSYTFAYALSGRLAIHALPGQPQLILQGSVTNVIF